jgi:hypothetical protein
MSLDRYRAIRNLVATATPPVRTAQRTVRGIDAEVDRSLDRLSERTLLAIGWGTIGASTVLAVGVASSLVPTVAAQSAGQAEEIMCQTGAGEAITFGFGLIALLLLVMAGFRGAMGLNNMGSQRSDKKREGQDQIKGAGYSLGGVFALIAFPPLLEQFGLATISCVTFAPF